MHYRLYLPACLLLTILLIYLFIFHSHHQRMTDDDVQPNQRMMEVLERAYSLPCNKPVLAVSSCQLVNSLSASESNNLSQQYFAL